jgi:hypothetical protein
MKCSTLEGGVMCGLRGIALLIVGASLLTRPAGADEAPFDVVTAGPGGKIAVPKGWRSFDKIKPEMLIYRQGDGIGVPALDETQAPLQIGMTLEKFGGSKETPRQIVDQLAAAAKKAPRLEIVGEESVQAVQLSDGTAAILLKAEFVKEGRRRSFQMKLVAKDADSNAWIVSGHLVGGKESKWPTAQSNLVKWLEAHLVSFCLDGQKFDAEKVATAYKNRRP